MIRKGLYVAAVAGLAVVACDEATAPLAPQGPELSAAAASPRVVGSGHNETAAGLREFTFHALEGPQGDVKGSYKVVLPNGLFFEADVTCVAVEGNTGWVGGRIRASNAGAVVIGSGSMFFAIDDGEGKDSADVVSVAVFNAAEGADLAFCADRPLELATFAVTQGNVQVR